MNLFLEKTRFFLSDFTEQEMVPLDPSKLHKTGIKLRLKTQSNQVLEKDYVNMNSHSETT